MGKESFARRDAQMNKVQELDLEWDICAANGRESVFIQQALHNIETFKSRETRIPGYESSHFYLAAGLLQMIRQQAGVLELKHDLRFCEWGSGFGVVTCLAAMVGFNACGIEIEAKLVESASQLALDAGIDAKFVHGSYRPDSFFDHDTKATDFNQELEFSPFNFDVIYIYPWPAEAAHVDRHFYEFASPGTVLISYQGGGRFRIQRHL